MKLLVQITPGPEHPTRAALAFLIAKYALDQGHAVALFLAGESVQLLRAGVLDQVSEVGTGKLTGKLRELYDAIVSGGGRFYLSSTSCQAQALTAEDLQAKPVKLLPPEELRRLAQEFDERLTY